MSSDLAIRLQDIGKRYRVFSSRGDSMLDALGLGRFVPGLSGRLSEFWALRNVDLELGRGERVGIIGRNGAGKTTLLKLITGNLPPTEGTLEVNGHVQALLDVGGGLHPEFTGYENIRAALTYRGLSPRDMRAAEREISDFTELSDFLERPYKTYSLGMQARLSFAIATTIRPEILIIDEVLGAGDAYFAMKSMDRMRQLVESGASVLLVTHGLDYIQRFCHRAIWLDRGQVVMSGNSIDVLKAYEKFIRVLNERRLKGRNRRALLDARKTTRRGTVTDGYTSTIVVRLTFVGPPDSSCAVADVRLRKNGESEDHILVGGPQDADASQSAWVILDRTHWSEPRREGSDMFRSLVPTMRVEGPVQLGGMLGFRLWTYYDDATYELEIRHRASAEGTLTVRLLVDGVTVSEATHVAMAEWRTSTVTINPRTPVSVATAGAVVHEPATPGPEPVAAGAAQPAVDHPGANGAGPPGSPDQPATAAPPAPVTPPAVPAEPEPVVAADPQLAAEAGQADSTPAPLLPAEPAEPGVISRWPGEGNLLIERVALVDADGEERAVLSTGTPVTIRVLIRAIASGEMDLILAALIFRQEGMVATRHVSPLRRVSVTAGDALEAELDLGPLMLGNGRYLYSVGLYRDLDMDLIQRSHFYDYIDRSFAFEVQGGPKLRNELFAHPGTWTLNAHGAPRATHNEPVTASRLLAQDVAFSPFSNPDFYPFTIQSSETAPRLPTLTDLAGDARDDRQVAKRVLDWFVANATTIARELREENPVRLAALFVMHIVHQAHHYGGDEQAAARRAMFEDGYDPDVTLVKYINELEEADCALYTFAQARLLDGFRIRWQHVIVRSGLHGWIEAWIDDAWETFDATANVWLSGSGLELAKGGHRLYRRLYSPWDDPERPETRYCVRAIDEPILGTPGSLRSMMPGLGLYFLTPQQLAKMSTDLRVVAHSRVDEPRSAVGAIG